MDFSAGMYEKVLAPTAAFENLQRPMHDDAQDCHQVPWAASYLNPKNRVDSLTPIQRGPTAWRIDGCTALGTQFFAIPAFAAGKPPLRIDVFIPSQDAYPAYLRDTLQASEAMLLAGPRVAGLGISQHILRALEGWSIDRVDLEAAYMSMPFGSRIVFGNICADVASMNIHLVPEHDAERRMLSTKALQSMWRSSVSRWPESVDLCELELQFQLSDSVSLVRIPRKRPAETLVFKSQTDDFKYLYHELRTLLTLDAHPNIVSRPLYTVTKKCRFGGKHGVCGFVLEYYPLGSLRENVIRLAASHQLQPRDQLRWAHQITSALIHIHRSPEGFYADLRPDNVVLSGSHPSSANAVLIDFEQRGNWYAWSPPEIYHADYLAFIASSTSTPPTIKKHYAQLLNTHTSTSTSPPPHSSSPSHHDHYHYHYHYHNPPDGYCTSWLALPTPASREAAQVFLLGKLLWCLFEGVGGLNSAVTAHASFADAADHAFPAFLRTPPLLRDCITRCCCTAGAPPQRPLPVVKRGMKLFARAGAGAGAEGTAEGTAGEVQVAATRWWREELAETEAFLRRVKRARGGQGDNRGDRESEGGLAFLEQRPALEEVLAVIGRLEAGYGDAS